MEQPFGFITQGKSSLVCKLCHTLYGLNNLLKHSLAALIQLFKNLACSSRLCIYLVVYVDNIVITSNN